MITSNTSKINVDMKLKQRLKMFEEIDKMVKTDKLNPSIIESQEDLSNLDNSSLYNYSEKGFSKLHETTQKNFNLPMQSNKTKKNPKQDLPLNDQNHNNKPGIALYLESENKCFSKCNNSNSNYYVESTNELKSFLPTHDNESIFEREKEREVISVNNISNNENSNKINFNLLEEKKKINNSNFNLYKKNKVVITSKLPQYSSKSPQRKSEKLSDFDNNAYDFPQQISKKTNTDADVKGNYIESINNPNNNNNTKKKINIENAYKKSEGAINYLNSNQIENPFHKNISNELNMHTERNLIAISENSNKKTFDCHKINNNNNQCKSSNKVSLSTYENTSINTNQKANKIKKEVKKDLVECFEYDFYNFPLIKNIPDSKVYGTEQQNTNKQQLRNLNNNNNNSNYKYNYNTVNSQFNYNTPHKTAIDGFISKNSSKALNRNLNEFLNTNNKKNFATNKTKPESHYSSNNLNKTFDRSNTKTSIKSHSRSRSKSRRDTKDLNFSVDNTPDNRRMKSLKKIILNSKDPNFGERLYNYNFYLNEKSKNKLEQEEKQRVRSATPKITRKAKNLQRDEKAFHLRLYPYLAENENNNNQKIIKENSTETDNCEENKITNFINNKQNQQQPNMINNNKFQKIYDNFIEDASEINFVFDKNFVKNGFFQEENSIVYNKPKRSLSAHDLLGGEAFIDINKKNNKKRFIVNNYNKNIFDKKNFEDKNINFKPKLNKKSLDIASKFGPAIERLYPSNAYKKNKQEQKLQKFEKQNNNSYLNTQKIVFSNCSEISKRSVSPLINKNPNLSCIRNNSANKNDPVKRQHELYRKGLENMKNREEKSKDKMLFESENYKQFSYRPKINSRFNSNISNSNVTYYKTPKSLNSKNNIVNLNTKKKFTDDTLKLDLLENNLLSSQITNDNFYSAQQNMNPPDFDLNDDFSANINNESSSKADSNNIEKFKHIYEKNLIWKKKIENEAEKIKSSKEKKFYEKLTFKPQINKIEMPDDDKFIEKNLEQINDYVNKRRMNIKKQKDNEEFKQRKFNYGRNFVIKPTIPKEFNLLTEKKRSENKNNFNKSNINNSSNVNINNSNIYASETNKSPHRKDFLNSRSNSNCNINSKIKKVDFNNILAANNVNSIRNELQIEKFFCNEYEIGLENDDESQQQQNYFADKEKLYYENTIQQQHLMQNNYCNNNRNQGYLISKDDYNKKIYGNPNFHNLTSNSIFSYDNGKNNINEKKKSVSIEKRNIKVYNNYEANSNPDENSFSNMKHNSHHLNKNKFIGLGYNGEFPSEQIYEEAQKDQIDFVNAINNLHEKLVNLNI